MPLTWQISEIKSRAEAYRENPSGDLWIRAAGGIGRQDTNSNDAVRHGSSCSAVFCLYRGIKRSRSLHTIGGIVRVHHNSLRIYNNSQAGRRHCVHRGWNLDHSLPVKISFPRNW